MERECPSQESCWLSFNNKGQSKEWYGTALPMCNVVDAVCILLTAQERASLTSDQISQRSNLLRLATRCLMLRYYHPCDPNKNGVQVRDWSFSLRTKTSESQI